MIKLSKVESAETTGQIYLTIVVDAKTANIKSRECKNAAEQCIGHHLVLLSQAVTAKKHTDIIEQAFKKYLCDNLFKHYVDIISINNFIYNSREVFREYKDNIMLAGFNMTYEYLNYHEKEKENVRLG